MIIIVILVVANKIYVNQLSCVQMENCRHRSKYIWKKKHPSMAFCIKRNTSYLYWRENAYRDKTLEFSLFVCAVFFLSPIHQVGEKTQKKIGNSFLAKRHINIHTHTQFNLIKWSYNICCCCSCLSWPKALQKRMENTHLKLSSGLTHRLSLIDYPLKFQTIFNMPSTVLEEKKLFFSSVYGVCMRTSKWTIKQLCNWDITTRKVKKKTKKNDSTKFFLCGSINQLFVCV